MVRRRVRSRLMAHGAGAISLAIHEQAFPSWIRGDLKPPAMIEQQGPLDAVLVRQPAHHVVQQVGCSRQHGGAQTIDDDAAGAVGRFDQRIDLPVALQLVERDQKG